VTGLHIPPGEREEIYSLMKPYLRRMGLSEAGANCFGDYHPGNIMFNETNNLTSHTGDPRIDQTEIFLIDPAYLDIEGNVDRAEDIGTFLSKFVYNDFCLNQTCDKTVCDFELILKGYNHTISQNNLTLNEYYPTGATFDFQIALGILIETMFKIHKSSATNVQDRVQTSLEAVKYILKKRPFEIPH
jgi:hypothetical protein